MPPYEVRFFDENGDYSHSEEYDHDSDDAAIDAAGALAHPHAMEVWDAGRLVGRFAPLGF